MKRLTKSLHFYSNDIHDHTSSFNSIDCTILNDSFSNYTNLMNDYGHVMDKHLNYDVDGSEFDEIHKYISYFASPPSLSFS